MGALDLWHIEEAGCASDKTTARTCQLRYGLKSALIECACTIGNTSATFKNGAYGRMGLETLELLERRKVRVAII